MMGADMGSLIEEERKAVERMEELIEEWRQADTEEERQRITGEIKKLAMDRLGVEGTS